MKKRYRIGAVVAAAVAGVLSSGVAITYQTTTYPAVCSPTPAAKAPVPAR
jgi:hypothetical protein